MLPLLIVAASIFITDQGDGVLSVLVKCGGDVQVRVAASPVSGSFNL